MSLKSWIVKKGVAQYKKRIYLFLFVVLLSGVTFVVWKIYDKGYNRGVEVTEKAWIDSESKKILEFEAVIKELDDKLIKSSKIYSYKKRELDKLKEAYTLEDLQNEKLVVGIECVTRERLCTDRQRWSKIRGDIPEDYSECLSR